MTVGRAVGEIKDILVQYGIPNYLSEEVDKENGIYDLLDIIIEEVYRNERKTPSFSYGDISDKSHHVKD